MGWLIPAAVAVVSAIGTAVAAVASVLAAVVASIISAVAAIGVALWSTTVGLVLGSLEAFGLITTMQGANLMFSLGALNTIGGLAYTGAYMAISAISVAFKTFLDVIHFDVLYRVHKIAFIVSSDYRLMIAKIHYSLARYGEAIGMGAGFFTLAIENLRYLIMDVSAMLGRTYDVAEVTWMKEFRPLLQMIAWRAEDIAERPDIFWDAIEHAYVRDAHNIKSGFMSSMIMTVNHLLDGSAELLDDVSKIQGRVGKLIDDLPAFVKNEIKPEFAKISGRLDTFRDLVFKPNMSRIDGVIGVLEGRQAEAKAKIRDIIDRLRKPGDLLSDVDLLDRITRLKQEAVIAEVANREDDRDAEPIYQYTQGQQRRLDKIRAALAHDVKETHYGVKEVEAPAGVSISEVEPEFTWFVGDY